MLDYDDEADTILASNETEGDAFPPDAEPSEEPFDYFTITQTGDNRVQLRFFQEGPDGPGDGELVEVVNVVGGDARLLDQDDVEVVIG